MNDCQTRDVSIASLEATMKVFELERKALVDVLVVTHRVQKAIREHPKFEELTNPNRSWRIDNSIGNLLGVPCESYANEKEAVSRTWRLMAEGKRVGLMTDPNGKYTEWKLPIDYNCYTDWGAPFIGMEGVGMPVMPPRTMIRHCF